MFSVGHSSHSWEKFASLLGRYDVTAIADVRSSPYSRYSPQFSQSELKYALRSAGISYVFLGKELGGRPSDRSYFDNQIADYEKMAVDSSYKAGLERLIAGAQRYNVAMMCSEHDPLDCHRCLLVSRSLLNEHIVTQHILSDGTLTSQNEIEDKLLTLSGTGNDDLFMDHDEQISIAYKKRAKRIAYSLCEKPSDLLQAS